MKKAKITAIVRRYIDHEVARTSAALTYYLVFAFFPFLIVVCISLSRGNVLDFLTTSLSNIIPRQVLELASSYIQHVESIDSGQLFGWGIVLMLWSFYRVVSAIVSAMNKAWGVRPEKGFLRETLRLVGLTVFIMLSIFLVIAVLILNKSILNLVNVYVYPMKAFISIWRLLRYPLLAATLYMILSILFRFGPNRPLTLRQVLPGVLFSLVCWYVSSMLFAWYASEIANYTNVYGSLGAIIVLLLWLHWGGVAIILGCEMNAILDEHMQRRERSKSAGKTQQP